MGFRTHGRTSSPSRSGVGAGNPHDRLDAVPGVQRFPAGLHAQRQGKSPYRIEDIYIDLAAAHAIQKVLASKEGRDSMFAYRARSWKPLRPLKKWHVVNHQDERMVWSTILFESGSENAPKKWSRPTDGEGSMLLFNGEVAQRAWLHTYDNLITPLFLEENTWKPVPPKNLIRVEFVMRDGEDLRPVSDPALKAIWAEAAGGSHPAERVGTDSIVMSDVLLAGFYKLKVASEGKPTKFGFLGATAWDLEFKGIEETKTFVVEVEPLYTHVRFLAHTLVTIPKQLYVEDLNDPAKSKWMAEYVGLPVEVHDIDARVEFLWKAIELAAAQVSANDPHELKIYIVPECFFLGAYGAYQAANVEYVVGNLLRMVSDVKWKHWLFAFGTVNGTYGSQTGELGDLELSELFNYCPVIRGGANAGNSEKYVKLIQKTFFSAEMPAAGALIPNLRRPKGSGWTPTADPDSELRTSRPLAEEDVRKGFGATQNEALLGERLNALRQQVDCPEPLASSPIEPWHLPDWNEIQWNAMKDALAQAINTYGMTEVIREIRRFNAANPLKHLDPEFVKGLASVFERYIADLKEQDDSEPEVSLAVVGGAAGGSKAFSFGDFSFRCARKPGPLFDWDADIASRNQTRNLQKFPEEREASPAGELPADQILAIALEVCADHSQRRAKYASGAMPVDIHLVPSAGMGLNPDFIAVKEQGFAINCDGWNAVSIVLPVITDRGATIEKVDLGRGWPAQGGINPLHPHSEVLKKSGGDYEPIKPVQVDLNFDVKDIFAYGPGVLHIYPPQKLPA